MKHPSLHSLKLAVCLCSCSLLAIPTAIYAEEQEPTGQNATAQEAVGQNAPAQDPAGQNAPAQEAGSGTVTVMTEADYPALLCGNLTQSELEVLLAYALGDGIPNVDYYSINSICESAGWMMDGGVVRLGSTANYKTIYSVSGVNRFLSAFSDVQISESNPVSDQFIVSGDQLIFSGASLSDTCEATITHGEYNGQTMKVNYTSTLVDSPDADMGLPVGIPFEKTATLKITPEGRYRITEISDGTETLADDAAAGAPAAASTAAGAAAASTAAGAATSTSTAAGSAAGTSTAGGTASTGTASTATELSASSGTSEKITIPAEAAGLYADTLQHCYNLYLAHCNGTADTTTDVVEGVPENLAGMMRLAWQIYTNLIEVPAAAFTDVDSDGIPELILGLVSADGSGDGIVADVCTSRDGKMTILADDTWTFTGVGFSTDMSVLDNEGLAVYNHSGNGNDTIIWKKLSADGTAYEKIDSISTKLDYSIEGLIYYHGDASHQISEAQFNEIQKQYESEYPDPHLEAVLRAISPEFISEVRAGEVSISGAREDNAAAAASSDANAASAAGSAETAGAAANQSAGANQSAATADTSASQSAGTIEIPGDLFADGQSRLTQDGYILPDADTRELTQADLAGLSQKGLNYAINEFYARHGRQFVAHELQAYFGSMPWYLGIIPGDQFRDSVFSQTEHDNLDLCVAYQSVLGVYSPQ